LLALQRVLEEHGASLLSFRGPITIFWLTNNSSVAKFLGKGSGKLAIMLQILRLLHSARSCSLDENAKVARFFSFTFEDNCAEVDAFAFTWDDEWAYIAPPVSLVSKVIRKIPVFF
jgi:hypothetical protein